MNSPKTLYAYVWVVTNSLPANTTWMYSKILDLTLAHLTPHDLCLPASIHSQSFMPMYQPHISASPLCLCINIHHPNSTPFLRYITNLYHQPTFTAALYTILYSVHQSSTMYKFHLQPWASLPQLLTCLASSFPLASSYHLSLHLTTCRFVLPLAELTSNAEIISPVQHTGLSFEKHIISVSSKLLIWYEVLFTFLLSRSSSSTTIFPSFSFTQLAATKSLFHSIAAWLT